MDVPISSCINNTCSYGIDTFTNESLTEGYIISVAARNAVGLGEESSTMSQSELTPTFNCPRRSGVKCKSLLITMYELRVYFQFTIIKMQ